MSYQMYSPTSPSSRPPSRGTFSNLPEMPHASPKEQTLLWQQNTYLCDSGIQSGESTHAPPTLCGKEDDLDDPMAFDWDPTVFDHGFSQEQVDDISLELDQTRIRSAVFLEALEKDIDVPSSPFNSPQPTAGQQLAKPSEMPEHTTLNLDNFQDDVDLATKLIPGLVGLLLDEDQFVVTQATEIVQQLLKREVSQQAVINSQPVIAALGRVCTWSNCVETINRAADVLHFLSHNPVGLLNIFECNVIPALVKLLGSTKDSTLFFAITTLHSLLLELNGAKAAVSHAGGVQIMATLLNHNNHKFLAILSDCLRILAVKNPENKMIILSNGGPAELVHIMRSYNHDKLLEKTSNLIRILSACTCNKLAIVEAGGMQALALHIGTNYPQIVYNCLCALRNLSDAATKEDNVDGLLQGLVHLLGSNNVRVVTYSAAILSNMTSNNQHNKVTVFRAGGVEALVHVIKQTKDLEILESALSALRHLTSRHSEAEMAQNTVRVSYGIQVIVELLHSPSSLPVIKAVIDVIRNLALCPGNNAFLRNHGVIPRLVQLLMEGYQASAQRRPPAATAGNDQSNHLDEVRAERILERALGTLLVLARDPHSRVIIRGLNVIPIFEQLLYSEIDGVKRLAEEVLWRFASDAEDSEMSASGGNTPPLMTLLSPRNERADSCAAGALFRMPDNKPDDKKQFSIEPASSIFTDDSGMWSGMSSDMDINMLSSEEAYQDQLPHQDADINMLGQEEAYNDQMYQGQGPPSAHATGHNAYAPQGFDLNGYETEFKGFHFKG